jgi:hypothetical protein
MFQHLQRAGQAAAVATALAIVTPQVAQAAPTFAASPASVHQEGGLTQVRYYRRHWHHGYWGGPGPVIAGAALGLFGLAANAAIADSYYDSYDYPYYAPYGPVGIYPGYGYSGYPYGGYGGWHHGWHHGWGHGWRGPVGWHNHR